MARHRQMAFPSPLVDIELAQDPERALWVPHRRDRIFVPATAPPNTGVLQGFNVGTLTVNFGAVDWSHIENVFMDRMAKSMNDFAKEMQRSMAAFERMAPTIALLQEPPSLTLLREPDESDRPRVVMNSERFALNYEAICDCSPGRHEFLHDEYIARRATDLFNGRR